MPKRVQYSWQGILKQVIYKLAKPKTSPTHKRRVASLLQVQAGKLQAFADSQPQPPKKITPVPRHIVQYLTDYPDSSIKNLCIAVKISAFTAVKWRRQFNAERGIIGRPRGRPKKGSIHAR
jgi:hypothetical protein